MGQGIETQVTRAVESAEKRRQIHVTKEVLEKVFTAKDRM
jgi:hypothetical protein